MLGHGLSQGPPRRDITASGNIHQSSSSSFSISRMDGRLLARKFPFSVRLTKPGTSVAVIKFRMIKLTGALMSSECGKRSAPAAVRALPVPRAFQMGAVCVAGCFSAGNHFSA
ncbi:hypothetical protein SKAU_G00074090 [Synaphobranchus kaupii]|uniref:Uncharacterized protein n=1 Tax=Synaphobranchus kaupii TaxID=118154 RepID=A0A9Q1J9T4_SYNKA|nr:hypothetical protein SKAU_G00074090 [Synaphobranchus kaupii]